MAYLKNPRNPPDHNRPFRVYPYVHLETPTIPLANRLFNLGSILGLVIPAGIATIGIYTGVTNTWINQAPAIAATSGLPTVGLLVFLIFIPLLCSLSFAGTGWLIGMLLVRSPRETPDKE